jgi:hypothetical protein
MNTALAAAGILPSHAESVAIGFLISHEFRTRPPTAHPHH